MNTTNYDENNLEEMELTAQSVGNSSSEQIIKKKKKEKKSKEISYKQELLRKMIHLCSLSIPIFYIFVSKSQALYVLVPLALLMIITDILTKKVKPLSEIYQKIFGKMLRKHEKSSKKLLLNGASWVLISAVLTVAIFPKIIAVTAFMILIVSDISAALIGRKFGKTPLFNKSWEGTSAFMVSAWLLVGVLGYLFAAPWTYFAVGFVAAIVGAFAEAASKLLKADDNFSVPISIGIVMWAGGLIVANYTVSFINLL